MIITLSALRSAGGRFLRWWLQELRSMGHDVIAKVAPAWNRSITIFLDKGSLQLLNESAVSKELAPTTTSGWTATELADSLLECLKGSEQNGGRAHILVSPNKVFIQQVRLPVAALPHLASALSLQLPKLLPVSPDQLLTAFELVSSDAVSGVIELAAVKRSDVEPMVKALSTAGLHVSTIRLADSTNATPRFSFQLASDVGVQPRLRRFDRMLIGAAAGLGIICTALVATQSYRARQALTSAAAEIRSKASLALERRQSVISKLEPLSELWDLEKRAGVSSTLAEVTARTPKDTWVSTLELRDTHLRLLGVSADSAALVKQLSGSTLFNDVELRSSMSTGAGTGKERFEISAEIRGSSP